MTYVLLIKFNPPTDTRSNHNIYILYDGMVGITSA